MLHPYPDLGVKIGVPKKIGVKIGVPKLEATREVLENDQHNPAHEWSGLQS